MLEVLHDADGNYFAKVSDRSGEALVYVNTGTDEASALGFFSALSAALIEGFRNGVKS